MIRPEDLIIGDSHDLACSHLESQGVLKAMTIDALLEVEHLDLGSVIFGKVVGLESGQNAIVVVVVGHKDDLLRVIAQPGLETLREDLGRVEKGAHDSDILGGELGILDDGVRLVLLAIVVRDDALDIALGSIKSVGCQYKDT